MSMVTRCPSCATLFRVTPQQLQARDGQVRCGRCMTVFDGFTGLAILPDQTPPEAPLPAAMESAALAVTHEMPATETKAAVAGDAVAPTVPEPTTEPPLPVGFEFEPIETEAAPATRSSFEPMVKRAPAGADARSRTALSSLPPIKGDELFLEQARAKRRSRSWVWSAGSALMLLALAGQAPYSYRSELVATYPGLRPAVAQLCELLECTVALPQRPKLINIEASDLQSVDPARPGVIRLTATLRNHAGYDLGYPALDLVLTNTKEHTLARRIFLPEEYLDKSKNRRAGFPASAEITIHLDLDTGELGAAGFRLDLLPAPAR